MRLMISLALSCSSGDGTVEIFDFYVNDVPNDPIRAGEWQTAAR